MYCPADIVVNNATKDKIKVNWKLPVVTDNSGNLPAVISNMQPGTDLTVPGSYEVAYQATDQTGNKNVNCSFRITLECKYFKNWGKRGGGTRVREVGGWSGPVRGKQGWLSDASAYLPQMLPRFESQRRRHMGIEFVVGSHLCPRCFLLLLKFFFLSPPIGHFKSIL